MAENNSNENSGNNPVNNNQGSTDNGKNSNKTPDTVDLQPIRSVVYDGFTKDNKKQ